MIFCGRGGCGESSGDRNGVQCGFHPILDTGATDFMHDAGLFEGVETIHLDGRMMRGGPEDLSSGGRRHPFEIGFRVRLGEKRRWISLISLAATLGYPCSWRKSRIWVDRHVRLLHGKIVHRE